MRPGQRGAQLLRGSRWRSAGRSASRLLDQRADPVDLPARARPRRGCARSPRRGALSANSLVTHRRAARRQLVDRADVEVGEVAHRQRARDRRGAHHQQVRLQRPASSPACGAAPGAAATPKRCCSSTIARPEPARTARRPGSPRACRPPAPPRPTGHALQHLRARLALAAAGQPGDADAQRLQPAARACGSAARPGSRSAPSARTASRRRSPCAAASAATTVLPEPTSPCSRRCIGCAARQVGARSRRTHALLRARSARTAAPPAAARAARRARRAAPARAAARARACACSCDSCCASSSSNFRRCQAGWLWSSSAASAASGGGWCSSCSASRSAAARPAAASGGSTSCERRARQRRGDRPCAGRPAAAARWSGRPASARSASGVRRRPP